MDTLRQQKETMDPLQRTRMKMMKNRDEMILIEDERILFHRREQAIVDYLLLHLINKRRTTMDTLHQQKETMNPLQRTRMKMMKNRDEMMLIEDEKMLFHRREQLWIIFFFISSTKENNYRYSSSTKRNYGSFAKNTYEDILETSCCGGYF